jgi:hypothetical protein
MDPFLGKKQTSDKKKQTSDKKEQPPPSQLGEYPVSCSPVSFPDGWEKYESGDFSLFPKDIILFIANYLSRSNRGVLEQVSKYFLTIIRSKWPPMPEYLILYNLNITIGYLLELSLRELCMNLHNVEITYNNATSNSKMGPARYFFGRTCHCPPSISIVNPSRWEGLMLKFGKDKYPIYQELWRYHMEECKNLVYLTLTDVENIYLKIENFKKLKGLFVKLKLADGLRGIFFPPLNIKQIVLYAEENYQEHHTKFSEGYENRLSLYASECTELEFW